jgi:sugar lactone lactonase YvrE
MSRSVNHIGQSVDPGLEADATLRKKDGKDIVILGNREVVLSELVVEESRVGPRQIKPLVPGDGQRLFDDGGPGGRFDLTRTTESGKIRCRMNVKSRPDRHVLLADLVFPESPRWHDGRLWVSDWGANEVIAVDPAGRSEVVARVESFPMCIDHLPDGRLLIVSSADRRLLRQEPDGSLVEHADLASLGEYPWNDIVVDGRGNAYVNNIGFHFPGGEFAPGFIALVTPGGVVSRVADGLAFPNGMAVQPNNVTLIVAESYGQKLTAFDIGPDGGLSGRRTWAEVDDHPDGICLDADGAIWYADVGNKRCVRVREGGDVLDVMDLDRGCFACILGGPDRRTLFMTVNEWRGSEGMGGARNGQVLAVETPVQGVGWP